VFLVLYSVVVEILIQVFPRIHIVQEWNWKHAFMLSLLLIMLSIVIVVEGIWFFHTKVVWLVGIYAI
jgi:hypothetical protein